MSTSFAADLSDLIKTYVQKGSRGTIPICSTVLGLMSLMKMFHTCDPTEVGKYLNANEHTYM